MKVGELVRFHQEHFFEGAVQLRWVQERPDQAQQAARSYVFHGPRYHGAGEAEQEGVGDGHRLTDSASFVGDLLDSILSGLSGAETNPYLLAVAGYGAGKSHLATAIAALLGAPESDTARAIVDHLAQADTDIAQTVGKRLEQLGRPVLVLCLDGMAGFHLGNALSQAVFAQLERYGVDAGAIRALSPRFQTAEQFVQRNFEFRADVFARHLPGMPADAILSALQHQDEAVYTAVDAIYSDANGSPIPVVGQESAQELIKTLCDVYCGPNGAFSSVVILFDEFGRYLEYAAEKPRLAGDSTLQQIFQGVQDSSDKARFIGFIQYELKMYLKRFSSADLRQLQRYITRFDAAEKTYLSTNLETIFAHMIGKDEPALEQVWRQAGAQMAQAASWRAMSPALPGFARYPVWNEPERFAQVIVRGCWPLHPLATWFLTRQSDVVQSRSALTFIKESIERIASEDALAANRLRQISAAELVLHGMLPEMIAAERETGVAVAETLQLLLEKFQAHLSSEQRLVLAGVAILEKMRVAKQSQPSMDALLCEATALDGETLHAALLALSQDLGALEWNRDLGQYELIADATTRGQFQQWLRKRQTSLTPEAIQNLFVRNITKDDGLGDLATDFGGLHEISTTEWFYAAHYASTHTVEQTIKTATREWEQSIHPKDAKGRIIYVYLHENDDLAEFETKVARVLDTETKRLGQSALPVWVVAIADREGVIAEHLGRLHLFETPLSADEQERFRRFIPEECARSRLALKEAMVRALKERLYWIAGLDETPSGRVKAVGEAVFARVYPKSLPFPFDGFATTAGGGALDAAQIMRSLITHQVDGPWVQAQPKRLQNRVQAVLVRSWRVLATTGKLTAPEHPEVKAVLESLQHAHIDHPKRTLWESYRALIAPPHGMNSASAGLMLGLLIGGRHPPRRIEQGGEMVAASDWIGTAFPAQKGKHYLDPAVLERTMLRFLSEDAEGRWRTLLDRWETEQRYERLVKLAQEAEQMHRVDPIPEVLEGHFKYLRDRSERAAVKLRTLRTQLDDWEVSLERAERQNDVGEMLRLSSLLMRQQHEVDDDGIHWSASAVEDCNRLLIPLRQMVSALIADWIPRQSCHNATDVSSFRHRIEKAVGSLKGLGFETEAQVLEGQAQRAIFQVEKRQQFALTLAESDDYPRQPNPSDSTLVRDLIDDIEKGEHLIEAVERARGVLADQEIQARIGAIQQRMQRLRTQLERQRTQLSALYEAVPDSDEALREMLARAARLQHLFVGTRDESEVSDLALLLDRMQVDIAKWETGDLNPERLTELLEQQIAGQLSEFQTFIASREIEPVWDLTAMYRSLAQTRIATAREQSAEWVERHWRDADQIADLDAAHCISLERELSNPPAYLAADDRARIKQPLAQIAKRRAELDEQARNERLQAWMRPLLALGSVDRFDQPMTEQWLKTARQPPDALREEEQAALAPIIETLTAHLDQMSVSEIMRRIERLPTSHQEEILRQLRALLVER